MAGIDLALDMARDVANPVDIGDGSAAEFHYKAAHDARRIPLERGWSPMRKTEDARAKRRVYITARMWASNPAAAATGGAKMGRYIDDILQPGEKVLYSDQRALDILSEIGRAHV